MDEHPSSPPSKDLIELLLVGRKIEAIKLFRETTGAGLKEAKEAVERLQAELAATHPELLQKKTGCGATSAVFLAGTLGFPVVVMERISA